MSVTNKTILSFLIGMGIVCLLLCCLLIKPALDGAHKFFTFAKKAPAQTVQSQRPSAHKQIPVDREEPDERVPTAPEQNILEDESSVAVRPLVALSGVSKKEVFELRKEAVAASPFAREDYEPSLEVFGGIESYKSWIAATACSDPKTHKSNTHGTSEETRFINNPTALIALEMPFLYPQEATWCTRDDVNMIMQKIAYDKLNQEVTVTYLNLPFNTRTNHAFYAFNGVNARDLGYPYMYVDTQRSSYKLEFLEKDNASTEPVKLQNFIHVGFSCGTSGGCNNGSPRQPKLEFHEDSTPSTQDREIYIKLWKEQPGSVEDEADIVERIIIQGKPEQTEN